MNAFAVAAAFVASASAFGQWSTESGPLEYGPRFFWGNEPEKPESLPASKLSALSPIATKVVEALQDRSVERGIIWDVHTDVKVEDDFIMQHPPASHWGRPAATLTVAKQCNEATSEAGVMCTDHLLHTCSQDDDCQARDPSYASGTCQVVHSTVTTPGQQPQQLCVSHSYHHYETVYKTMIKAKKFVDITSLDSPDSIGSGGAPDKYAVAIRNAITYLSNTGEPVIVKLHFGSVFMAREDTKAILDLLTADMNKSSPMQVYVSTMRAFQDSWNHGKIVAVDGRYLLEGGSNYYTYDYLLEHPVHDVSMVTEGSNALTAHRYAANLWRPVCEWNNLWDGLGASHAMYSLWRDGSPAGPYYRSDPPSRACPTVFDDLQEGDLQEGDDASGITVIPVSRLGRLTTDLADGEMAQLQGADIAFTALFAAAKESIKLSQQDVLPVIFPRSNMAGGTDKVTLTGLQDTWIMVGGIADALIRGVDVYMVLSAPCAFGANIRDPSLGPAWSDVSLDPGLECPTLNDMDPDGPGDGFDFFGEDPNSIGRRRRLTYGYGWSVENAADWVFAYFAYDQEHRPAGMSPADVAAMICEKLHVTHIRVHKDEATYPTGKQIGNHAKVIIIDDEVYYMGSHNFYGAGLQEFGQIVDDQATVEKFVGEYWSPMWSESQVGVVSGSESTTCAWSDRLASRAEPWNQIKEGDWNDLEIDFHGLDNYLVRIFT